MTKTIVYFLLILSLICTSVYAHDVIRGPVPNELINKLHSNDKKERISAFSQLHFYMGPDVYQYLEEGVNDQDLDIVRAALGPLTHCKSKFYPRYLELIKNPNKGLRYDAAVALVRSGDKRRFQCLLDLLKDTDNQIRIYAVDCLGEIGDKTAITPLWNLYNEEKVNKIKSFIIKSLARLKDDKIMPYLIEDTKSKDSVIKYNAITGLSYINNDESIKLLIDLLKDGDRNLQIGIVTLLGRAKSKKAVPYLLEFIDSYLSRNVIMSLDEIGDKRAIPYLMNRIQNDYTRDNTYYTGETLQIVSNLSKRPFDSVSYNSKSVEQRKQIIKEWLDWWTTTRNSYEPVNITSELTKKLKSNNIEERRKAAYELSNSGDKSNIHYLIEALNDNDNIVRSCAVYALGAIKEESAKTVLIGMLRDKDSNVRNSAVDALGEFNDKTLIPVLARALNDDYAHVRAKAIIALGKIGTLTVVPYLIRGSRDPDPNVKMHSVDWLNKIEAKSKTNWFIVNILKHIYLIMIILCVLITFTYVSIRILKKNK